AEGEKNQVTENKNGLICDFGSAAPTPAMAFRAPMSGKVTFALKDTEPYLRQNGNSGGSVRLSLYVNNETEPRQTCEMSVSRQKANFPQIELEVQKGDYIRLQALAVGTPSAPSVHATPIITYLNEEPSEQGPDTPEAPAAPTNVTAGEITQTSVKLSWTAPQGSQAAKYEIYNGAEKLAEVEGNTTTAVVNGLTAETQYTLTVKTVDAVGNQSEGADVTFTTLQEEAPPEDTTAEKQQLQALITQAEKKIAEGKYTEASVKAVQDQIDASRALLEAAAPTKAQLTKALGDLNKAVGELKEKEDPTPIPPAKWIFEDVEENPGHWKYENIKYVYEKNIMNGISGTKLFDPDAKLNRAMFATVLYRMAGSPKITFVNKFKDVKDGKYYSEAIIWANSKGIVEGYSDGNYGVQDNITREQIAKMLNLYAKVQNYDINDKKDLGSFTDADKVSGWATGFMQWATAVEMITGKPNEDGKTYRLDPKGQATRAECAKMLTMFSKKYEQ
ncbi:MAG: S-layer homology domain-containing protein, partial [Lachnospiraceae bacterium]|nr:S-layer homology domain-containing protein [Lachnospiraceae bacterium]